MICRLGLFSLLGVLALTTPSPAQLAPEIGSVFPPGGKAGTTVAVQLGGAEWTPDMQFFVHDKRVKLEILGPPGELLIPPPPYWFGAKGRLTGPPLLRERPARFILPADLPPGPIRWQAANANGITSAGVFVVGVGLELIEDEKRTAAQPLPSLPVTVSGRLLKNEEVDRYRFVATKAGPVTCELTARRLGSNFNGVIEVFDARNRRLAEAVDTEGLDPVLTFSAVVGTEYTVAVRDIDHAGDRSYTYRLALTPGPRVLAVLPAVGKRGETREVEFVGVGLATGGPGVESLRRPVTFPAGPATSFVYQLETPWGSVPYTFPLDDLTETVRSVGNAQPMPLVVPGAVTGTLDSPTAEARYMLAGKKGDRWSIAAEARRFGSPLDVTLRLLGPDGKDLAHNDDLPATTDAGLEFTVPADGAYQLVVGDTTGSGGSRAAVYRVAVRHPIDGYRLHVSAQKLSLPLGQKTPLTVQATRTGQFKGPITLTIAGLPAGVTAPPSPVIPADKNELVVSLESAADAAVTASLFTITGTAEVGGKSTSRPALATAAGNLAPRHHTETDTPDLLVALTMKPRVKGEPVDKDTGRKVPRGSTHPAEVTVQRLEGYAGEITLRQAARQSYQVQGITGRDVTIPAGVTRFFYPCFMPEWLETSRTSRMGIVAEVKVPDPKGNVRHLVVPIEGFVTMTMEGALLKLSSPDVERQVRAGEAFTVKVKLARSPHLSGPVRLELRLPDDLTGMATADPVAVPPDRLEADFRILPTAAAGRLTGEQVFTIRGTAVQPGNLPVVSETVVRIVPATVK
ncbi:PPC domain-containing protein [Fimbriiglobus ruber]|uniref:Putative serine proteinase, subtilase family n=1 Tax=Fimbriiglobus ruber TaxID=1908690 RepID=A0A225E0R6_9BACT|nr:PPC domain-containing protein [Fimbriiglobus ruber]OWK46773.1 putative serine proteinase, subtilase family [Fimbriiglobus ruber]